MSENNGTINIYIPIEKYSESEVSNTIERCLSVLDSCTITDCIKYRHDTNSKVTKGKYKCITFFGRVYWFWDTIKEEFIKLAVYIGVDHIHAEVNNNNNSITSFDIKRYIETKTS